MASQPTPNTFKYQNIKNEAVNDMSTTQTVSN